MQKKSGFTLIELLIVIAIVALLATLALYFSLGQISKSRDGKRKADLDLLKTVFENYYNDHNIYPPADALATCDSTALDPYLKNIPCDPGTKTPYCYIYDTDNPGQSYRLLASLTSTEDPIIAELGCNNEGYCGWEDECKDYGNKFNYIIASGNTESLGDGIIVGGSIGAEPLPSTVPGSYACSNPLDGASRCGSYPDPVGSGCGITFSDVAQCEAYCPRSPLYVRCGYNN